MKKIVFCFCGILLVSAAVVVAQPGQSEFIPMTEVPASEQLPAARLVIAAYAFVWLAFLSYVWLMWKRLGKVEAGLSALSTQLAKRRP